jgi:hypothetical protein
VYGGFSPGKSKNSFSTVLGLSTIIFPSKNILIMQ